jgi:hypothetical protein
MDHAEVRSRLDAERRTLARDGEVADVRPQVTRLRGADGSLHGVAWSGLTAATADAAIAAEVEHHRRLGVAFEWKAYAHDGPPDLVDRLRRHGFDVGPCEAVMVYDLADQPAWVRDGAPAGPDRPPFRWRVVRIDRPERIADFRRVAEEVFGKDYGLTAGHLAAALAAGSTQHLGYVAYAGGNDDAPGPAAGEPAGIGRLYTHPRSHFAGLYGGGTRAAFRGRGVYRATVAARARDAIELGARYLLVDALPTSRPILERMGFTQLTETWPCERRP